LLEGNLTRDPELRKTPKGTSVCSFSVGCNRAYKYEDELQRETSFFDIETWAKLAERCGEELTKGRGVRVVGRLKQDRWTDTEGKNRSRIKVVAEHVEFRPKPKEETKPDAESEELEGLDLEHAGTADAPSISEKEAVPF
jgi:single-strand DNA-binding protein